MSLFSGYDPWIVAASFAIATFASCVALDFVSHVGSEDRCEALAWWLGGSVVMGTGIWSLHFIGMLAYAWPMQLGFDKVRTFLSWGSGVAVSAIAFGIVGRGSLTTRRLLAGSAAMAAGICAMHYTGMAAIELVPGITWNPWLIAASALMAFCGSAAALLIFFRLRQDSGRHWMTRVTSGLLMATAITGMHYMGMAAASVPWGAVCLSTDIPAGEGLVMLLVLSTGSLLAIALLVSLHRAGPRDWPDPCRTPMAGCSSRPIWTR